MIKNINKNFCKLLVLGLFLGMSSAFAQDVTVDEDKSNFLEGVQVLTSEPHRLAGTEEFNAAADYIVKELKTAGYDNVIEQEFFIPQLLTDASISIGGKELPMYAIRANLWQGSALRKDKVTVEAFYAGDGSPEAYGDINPIGKIVCLNYANARRWQDAFAMGAKAVIFIEDGDIPQEFARFENITADLPRFYMTQEDFDMSGIRDGVREVTIQSKPTWQRLTSRNIIAWLPGTDPDFDLEKEEVIILTAQLDSFGTVPELSNGAKGAANCMALLQMAKKLQQDKPRRNIMFVFLGGEGRLLTGSQNLYNAIFRNENITGSRVTHSDYIQNYKEEKIFLGKMIEVLNDRTFFDDFTPVTRQVLVKLRDYSQSESGEDIGMISEENLKKMRLEKQDAKGNKGKIEAIDKHVDELAAEKSKWDSLRRAIGKEEFSDDVKPQMDAIIKKIDGNLNSRLAEVSELMKQKEQAVEISKLFKNKQIIINLSVDFSGNGPLWGFAQWDSEKYLSQAFYNTVGYYVGVFSAIDTVASEIEDKLNYFQTGTTNIRLGPDMYFPGKTMYSGMIAARFGIYGLRVGTCSDALIYQGHPSDTYMNVNVERIYDYSKDFYTYAQSMFSSPEFSLRQRVRKVLNFLDYTWDGERVNGSSAMMRSKGSAIANTPAAGAMLGVANSKYYLPGFDLAIRTVVEQNGAFVLGPVDFKQMGFPNWNAVLFDEFGRVNSCNSAQTVESRVNMFPCLFESVVAMSPPSLVSAKTLVLNAANDGGFRSQDSYIMESPLVVSSFMPDTSLGVKFVNKFGMLLINATDEDPLGIGYPVTDVNFSTTESSAKDKFMIDESRLDILRKKRITNDSLEWLQGLAKNALHKAVAAKNIATKYAEYNMVNLLNKRIYAPILTSMNDLVKAVVILMILMIPFAYALERLLIGTPHIYKQIGWYCFFFILTFVILYNVHPAFAIATEPIVIFLAFLIIILSSMVIFILLSRFKQEIKAVQGMELTVHTVDVSRFSTIIAAIAMGISTMRRRPMRTFLTTITVILLTFSILSFASFDAQGGIFKRHIGSSANVKSIFIHHPVWKTLANRVSDISRHIMQEKGVVTERYWISPEDAAEAQLFCVPLANVNDGEKITKLDAIVGLDTMDVIGQPDLLAAFNGDKNFKIAEDAIYFTQSTADTLGIKPGEKVTVMGYLFTFAGVLDQNKLIKFVQIDDTPIYPIDFNDESMQKDTGLKLADEGEEDLDADSSFLPYLNSSVVAFINSKRAEQLNGRLIGVCVYPNKGVDIEPIAEQLARLAPAPVYATLNDGIYRLYFTTMLATSGMQNIIIPIILGGLIIFGTMLGSVTDRQKEIYTFSALGLAPAHIGMLFFAESSVYAVIGGLGGYILAQVVAILASWLSSFTAIQIPEMNYSSTNAIFAILVVMATVLLSTIYPAYRGAKSANPGVARNWKTPKPEGDKWMFTFPFTVSEYDITGVMSFILEHFNNFSDCSLGVFLAEHTKIYANGKQLVLQSNIATAPFDLGVTQEFSITSVPSEIEGVDEVHISITRNSGTTGDWRRTNRPFINDLRKQFLIWRSLPPETMEDYRKKTLVMLGRAKADKEVANNV
ncbi:MAG: M28 family peptidase [Kiritimatiellae bacterium]|jgi:ABC-type antimicrobial peptide transport system permease subunit|nr:M28 family peptidase [Kiritimatiellia bacterium]